MLKKDLRKAPTYNISIDPIQSRLYDRLNYFDQNAIIAVTGPTGSGKSGCSVALATMLDVDTSGYTRFYHYDNDGNVVLPKVIFTPKQFIDLIKKGAEDRKVGRKSVLPKGSWIVWDEAGVTMDNTEFMTAKSKLIKYLLQTYRYLNIGLLLTVPDIESIALSTRRLLHGHLHIYGDPKQPLDRNEYRRGSFHWFNKKVNSPELRSYREVYYNNKLKNRFLKISEYNVPKPPQDVLNAYEIKKEEYATSLYDNIKTELAAMKGVIGIKDGIKSPTNIQDILKYVLTDENKFKGVKGNFDPDLIEVELGARPTMSKKVAKALNTYSQRGTLDELKQKYKFTNESQNV